MEPGGWRAFRGTCPLSECHPPERQRPTKGVSNQQCQTFLSNVRPLDRLGRRWCPVLLSVPIKELCPTQTPNGPSGRVYCRMDRADAFSAAQTGAVPPTSTCCITVHGL